MPDPVLLPCDGCGQLVSSGHISRRLKRLAWSTRFRPVHIQSLLLGGIAASLDSEFLYAPESSFAGEAGNLLRAAQISTKGKSPEAILGEFQKRGLMLVHVVECPLEKDTSDFDSAQLLGRQLHSTVARIRRSLKPKRVLLFSPTIEPVAEALRGAELGCPVWPLAGEIFLPTNDPTPGDIRALEAALSGANTPAI